MATSAGSIRLDTTKLDQLISDLKPRAEAIIDATAKSVEAYAKANAPVDTGALRSSIHTEHMGPFLYRVADGVEYGIHVEFPGITRKWAGHPFLGPAVETVRPMAEMKWRALLE